MRLRSLIASLFVLLIFTVSARASTVDDLADKLAQLIAVPDADAVYALVAAHHQDLIDDHDLAVLAVIALRRVDDPEASASLARLLRSSHERKRRLLYEEAVSHWAAGSCIEAAPLFRALLDRASPVEATHDKLNHEARLFLLSCHTQGRWLPDLVYSVGYDDDLAGSGSEATFIPETGSEIDTFIDGLTAAFPDTAIPKEITIGEKPVAGFWFGTKATATRLFYKGRRQSLIRVGADARIASRSGYDQLTGSFEMETSQPFGRVRGITAAGVFSRHARRGGSVPNLRQDTLTLSHSLIYPMPRHFTLSTGAEATFSETRSDGTSHFNHQGISIGLKHASSRTVKGLKGLGWRADIFSGHQSNTDTYQNASIIRLNTAAGPFDLSGKASLHLGLGLERLDYHHARQWLLNPHRETRRSVQAIISYPFGKGNMVRLRIDVIERVTPDPFDDGIKVNVGMEFRF